jgi:hypothetical protein
LRLEVEKDVDLESSHKKSGRSVEAAAGVSAGRCPTPYAPLQSRSPVSIQIMAIHIRPFPARAGHAEADARLARSVVVTSTGECQQERVVSMVRIPN